AERFDARLTVGAAHPPIGDAKLELRQRWRLFYCVDGGHQDRGVHAVARRSRSARRRHQDFGHWSLLLGHVGGVARLPLLEISKTVGEGRHDATRWPSYRLRSEWRPSVRDGDLSKVAG